MYQILCNRFICNCPVSANTILQPLLLTVRFVVVPLAVVLLPPSIQFCSTQFPSCLLYFAIVRLVLLQLVNGMFAIIPLEIVPFAIAPVQDMPLAIPPVYHMIMDLLLITCYFQLEGSTFTCHKFRNFSRIGVKIGF